MRAFSSLLYLWIFVPPVVAQKSQKIACQGIVRFNRLVQEPGWFFAKLRVAYKSRRFGVFFAKIRQICRFLAEVVQ
ncbi:MAG: hypothetical protein LBG42_01060 [Treponema sp.]|jgi:hypothetical protein|nr:hypothetical protein [Treponema sp.]